MMLETTIGTGNIILQYAQIYYKYISYIKFFLFIFHNLLLTINCFSLIFLYTKSTMIDLVLVLRFGFTERRGNPRHFILQNSSKD